MANIRRETGRHDWRPQLLKYGNERVPGMLCFNCRAHRYDQNSDLPITGCLAEVKVSNCGSSRLADYREQEMKRRAEQDQREHQADLADIARARLASEDSNFQKHLYRQLERETQ
jgi:hypothetical protein